LGLNVTQIQVTNTTGTNNTSFNYYFTDAGIVKSETLSVNASYAWQSGDELDVLVFTDRGNQFITQEVIP
jgi:protein involved in polysaccharide export with SLBB domain